MKSLLSIGTSISLFASLGLPINSWASPIAAWSPSDSLLLAKPRPVPANHAADVRYAVLLCLSEEVEVAKSSLSSAPVAPTSSQPQPAVLSTTTLATSPALPNFSGNFADETSAFSQRVQLATAHRLRGEYGQAEELYRQLVQESKEAIHAFFLAECAAANGNAQVAEAARELYAQRRQQAHAPQMAVPGSKSKRRATLPGRAASAKTPASPRLTRGENEVLTTASAKTSDRTVAGRVAPTLADTGKPQSANSVNPPIRLAAIVRHAQTGTALAGAQVRVFDPINLQELTATSDANGLVVIDGLRSGAMLKVLVFRKDIGSTETLVELSEAATKHAPIVGAILYLGADATSLERDVN